MSFAAPGDPAPGQIIRGHLHRDLVAGQNPDEIHPQFPGNMRQNHVTISNVNLERRVGQGFHHNTFHFDHVGFCQTLSLLVRMNLPAVSREGSAKLTVGDLLLALDFFSKAGAVVGHKEQMPALFALGRLHLSGLSVRQQEVLPLHRKDDEELPLVPAGVGSDDI